MALNHIQITNAKPRDKAYKLADADGKILNLPTKHAQVLPVSGLRGGGAHQISWSRLRRIARDRITLAELSARTGIHGTKLEKMLEGDGCRRHDALGWMRRKALAKIANY